MKTKICKKCGLSFQLSTKIKSKTVRLYNREFCLICSPYGSHNTIDLAGYRPKKEIIDGIEHKSCRTCSKIKPLTDFYFRSKWGRAYAVCIECNTLRDKNRRQEFKKWCVEYKGGKCEICGYNKCMRSLDFHHRDPEQKDFEISANWKVGKDKAMKELDKCSLICRNCHGEIHSGLISI